MINTERYSHFTNWIGNGGDNEEGLTPIEMFETAKTDFTIDDMADTFYNSLLWSMEEGDSIPDDMADSLQEAFAPLFQQFINYGVSQAVVEGLVGSLKTIPESLASFIEANDVTKGMFDVRLDINVEGNDLLTNKTPTHMSLFVTFDPREHIGIDFEESDIVLVLFDGWLSICVGETAV